MRGVERCHSTSVSLAEDVLQIERCRVLWRQQFPAYLLYLAAPDSEPKECSYAMWRGTYRWKALRQRAGDPRSSWTAKTKSDFSQKGKCRRTDG